MICIVSILAMFALLFIKTLEEYVTMRVYFVPLYFLMICGNKAQY